MSHGPPPLASQMSHHHHHHHQIPQMPPRGGSSSSRRHMPPQGMESYPQQPVKKQSKWSPEEDAVIIELRGKGMKWDDVSKHLPGRSSISCRLHYQNYLERRSEWDEERKNKLARLYDRFKAEMWAKVAEELQVPWRAAEAMHWQLGENDMARRAGQTPFTLAAVNAEATSRNSQLRGHAHSQSQESVGREMRASPPQSSYGGVGGSRPPSVMSRRDAAMSIGPPPPHPMASSVTAVPPQQQQPPPPPPPGDYTYKLGPGLPPIQHQPQPRVPGPLPGVAELTTGVTPYSTPPSVHLSGPPPPPPGQSIHHGMAPQHGHQPGPSMYAEQDHGRMKRPGSPDSRLRESNYRRRME
ncbi:hypothetical protein NLG97_g804 [Lecanicillium saksenae]|uniref:Uncharacterized protein n=1 Tax=Lecanicillium saksenae TaxID=468837 RepID=A0ACC1R8Y4_9HYPO|nr:hypothetical protein NLG97_g804 [Lecanicillium saksenae]